MKKSILSLAALLVIAVSLVSCGGGSPKANAQKFLDGLYHLDIASAKTVATAEAQKQLEMYEQMLSLTQTAQKDEAKKIKVDVKEPKVTGDNATVDYTTSADPRVQTLKMVKQNGEWKAAWSKTDMGAPGGGMGGMNSGMNSGSGMNAPMDTTVAPGPDMSSAPTGDTAKMMNK